MIPRLLIIGVMLLATGPALASAQTAAELKARQHAQATATFETHQHAHATATLEARQHAQATAVFEPQHEAQTAAELKAHKEAQARAEFEAQGGVVMRVPVEGKVVTGAPYSAEFVKESVQVLSDGNRIILRSSGRVYRDSQGRTRREEDLETGGVGHIAITDPVTKMSYSLDPETKVAWRTLTHVAVFIREQYTHASTDPAEVELKRRLETELEAQKRQQMEQQKQQQALVQGGVVGGVVRRTVEPVWEQKVEKLPAREVEGVMAEGTRTTRTIPAGAIGNEQPIVMVTEEWRSPELQVLVLTRTSDPRTGESTYKLFSISRAEPNRSWFEVPPDYTVKETGIRKAAGVMER